MYVCVYVHVHVRVYVHDYPQLRMDICVHKYLYLGIPQSSAPCISLQPRIARLAIYHICRVQWYVSW